MVEKIEYKLEEPKKVTKEYSLFKGLPVQVILLVIYYGNLLNIPLWLAWLPTILFGIMFTMFCIGFVIYLGYSLWVK